MTDKEKRDLHTETIVKHISIVKDLCYQMGISELGDSHDLSKFSTEEFEIYKYANGKKSPHDIARDTLGVSPSWIHHKARNQHHWEYWTDFNSATPNDDGTFTIVCKCVKMPYERIIEMFCDFVGAGKVYDKGDWTVETPLNYWNKNCEGQRAMHSDSAKLIKKLLTTLAEKESLEEFITWYHINKDKLQKQY